MNDPKLPHESPEPSEGPGAEQETEAVSSTASSAESPAADGFRADAEGPSEDHAEDHAEDPAEDPFEDHGADDDGFDDLDDLDELGVDGVVAQMTGAAATPPRKRRSPWISLVVLVACLYPLYSMFGDLRFWMQSNEPVALGDIQTQLEDGRVPPGLLNRYVSFEGTPDVQWATVLTKKSGAKVTYLRVVEGGGQLFAAIPRPESKNGQTPQYPSSFTGRISRFGDSPAFGWISKLFAQERVTQTHDTTAEGLAKALQADNTDGLRVQTESGSVRASSEDLVRLVVRPEDARVLLGAESFASTKAANAAVAALGYPYIALKPGAELLRYVVRIPPAKRDAAQKALLGHIEGEVDPTDPKEGVSVFPLSATYRIPADELELDGETLLFPYGDNTTSAGYEVAGDVLREVSLADGVMRVPLSTVTTVRIEKPIAIDPNGYLIEAGVPPSSQSTWALLWVVVLGVALTNGAVLVLTLRRRTA